MFEIKYKSLNPVFRIDIKKFFENKENPLLIKVIFIRYLNEQVLKDFFLRTNMSKNKIINDVVIKKIEEENKKYLKLDEKTSNILDFIEDKRFLGNWYSEIFKNLEINDENNKKIIDDYEEKYTNELIKYYHGRNYEISNDKFEEIIKATKKFHEAFYNEWLNQKIYFHKRSHSLGVWHIVQNKQVICTSSNSIFYKEIGGKKLVEKIETIEDFKRKPFFEKHYRNCRRELCNKVCNGTGYYINYAKVCISCLFRICGLFSYKEIQDKINIYEINAFFNSLP